MQEQPLGQYDFDSQLPDLAVAFDRDAVARLFEQRWPGPTPTPQISRVKPQDTKYQPARRCVTTYELLAERAGAAPERTLGVVEITPGGIALRLYDDDPRLPWLAQAVDTAEMRRRFADLLPGVMVETCTVAPVRYRPGVRCVFRYDLQTSAGQQIFFGKLLADGGEQLLATVGSLHAASQADVRLPRIPPPLAYWPDLHLLMQPEISGGAELNDLAFDPAQGEPTRERWLHAAGARLAGLHSAGVPGPPRTLTDDLEELGEYVAPMSQANAVLSQRYVAAVERMAERAGAATAAVATHGAFRTDQYLIEGDELVMIDLDGFCWAEPERDLGNFLAYLDWKAIRKPADAAFIARAGAIFMDGYRSAARPPDERRLAIYRAGSLLKIAGRRFRSLTVKEWHLVPKLIDAVEEAEI
jgi:hypothetical protein